MSSGTQAIGPGARGARPGWRTALALSGAALVLAACGTGGSRVCTPFDHPEGALWSGTANGDVAGAVRTFAGGTGAPVRFVAEAPVTDDERTVTDHRVDDDDEVTCVKGAEYRHVADDRSVAWSLRFRQTESRSGQPFENQLLKLDIEVESPPGMDIPDHLFRFPLLSLLDSSSNNFTSDTATGRYLASAAIGGTVYTDVLERTLIDRDALFAREETADAARWVRVVVARGAGLVEYELLDGTIYTLAPQ